MQLKPIQHTHTLQLSTEPTKRTAKTRKTNTVNNIGYSAGSRHIDVGPSEQAICCQIEYQISGTVLNVP